MDKIQIARKFDRAIKSLKPEKAIFFANQLECVEAFYIILRENADKLPNIIYSSARNIISEQSDRDSSSFRLVGNVSLDLLAYIQRILNYLFISEQENHFLKLANKEDELKNLISSHIYASQSYRNLLLENLQEQTFFINQLLRDFREDIIPFNFEREATVSRILEIKTLESKIFGSIVGLFYLYKMINSGIIITKRTIHKTIMLAMSLAHKYLDDIPYKNEMLAKIAGLDLQVFNELEREFMTMMDWNLAF